MITEFTIYTDGACRGNPGDGGWGVLIEYENISKSNYTYNTIKFIKTKYKEYKIHMIIGADQYEKIHLWKNSKYIIKNVNLIKNCKSEASKKNTELVEGKTVYLEQDTLTTNRYGHLLRYVWLNDEILVNEALVAEGFAKVNVFPPNTKYVGRLTDAQEQAQKLGNGMWSQCLQYESLAPVSTETLLP